MELFRGQYFLTVFEALTNQLLQSHARLHELLVADKFTQALQEEGVLLRPLLFKNNAMNYVVLANYSAAEHSAKPRTHTPFSKATLRR